MNKLNTKEWFLAILHPVKWLRYRRESNEIFKQSPKAETISFRWYLDEPKRQLELHIRSNLQKCRIIGVDPAKGKDVSVKTLIKRGDQK